MIRLVASDIDGTLLQGDETEIPRGIFEQIARLRKKNILFCPASGHRAFLCGLSPAVCPGGRGDSLSV